MNESVRLWKEDPLYYAGDELHRVKQDKIQKAILENKLDGLLFLKAEAVRYATDFYAKGYLRFLDLAYLTVIPKGKKPIVGYTSASDNYRIQIRSDIKDHRKLSSVNKWPDVIVQIFKDYNITNGIIGTDFLPFHLYQNIKKQLPNIEFVDISEIWTELTVHKHPVEIEMIRKATQITEVGILAAIEAIKPGVREYEVAACAEYNMRKQGNEMTPFITTIASGVNSAIFERIATEKVIRYGEMVIIDLGCVYRGYLGELGRTVCVGKPNKIQKEIYKVDYLALKESINAIKPGVKCEEIDAIARKVIKDNGYEKYEHKVRTGHQLGYGLHSLPAINKNVDYVLKPGMVICIEPRVTIFDKPEIGGVHLAGTVLVTENSHEVLSKLPFDDNFFN